MAVCLRRAWFTSLYSCACVLLMSSLVAAQPNPGSFDCNKEMPLAESVEELETDCQRYTVCPLAIACVPFAGTEPFPSGGFTMRFGVCMTFVGGTLGPGGVCVGGTKVIGGDFLTPTPIPIQRCDGAPCSEPL